MHRILILSVGGVLLLSLVGCVSAERKAEYSAWQRSDDGIRTVLLDEFESIYKQGWRERAEKKKQERLAREESARALARRQKEYERWLSSDDKEDGVSLEMFEQKYKDGWETRAEQKKCERIAREKKKAEREVILKAREKILEDSVARDLKWIREPYGEGRKEFLMYRELGGKVETGCLINPFLIVPLLAKIEPLEEDYRNHVRQLKEYRSQVEVVFKEEWLKVWTGPRHKMAESDRIAGEKLLTDFGLTHLPKSYAKFKQRREAADEFQRMFNEEFPKPWTIKESDTCWSAYTKLVERFAKVREEYFISRDELCSLWMSYRLGVLTEKDLASMDAEPLAVHLLPEDFYQEGYSFVSVKAIDDKTATFATKYAPKAFALYQKFEKEAKNLRVLIDAVSKQGLLMDMARFDRAFYNAVFKYNDIVRESNMLGEDMKAWSLDFRTAEKTSEDIAACDAKREVELRRFIDSLPSYIKDRTLGRVVPDSDMIPLPRWNYTVKKWDDVKKDYYKITNLWENVAIQRTELTQMQWMIVMGNNPSGHQKADCPVDNVSYEECMEFIRKLNEIDGCEYRLPEVEEQRVACLAGGNGDWGKRRNGVDGPIETMGWYEKNARTTMPVAMKEPNAWGLYDMHGNVLEQVAGRYEEQWGKKAKIAVESAYTATVRYSGLIFWNGENYWGFRLATSPTR